MLSASEVCCGSWKLPAYRVSTDCAVPVSRILRYNSIGDLHPAWWLRGFSWYNISNVTTNHKALWHNKIRDDIKCLYFEPGNGMGAVKFASEGRRKYIHVTVSSPK